MIKIRYKPLRTGGYSIFLDIYSAGKRERKFIGLRTSKDYSKTKFVSKEDIEAVEKARQLVCEYCKENPEKSARKKETTPSLIEFIKKKASVTKNSKVNIQTLEKHLNLFCGKKDVPFTIISEKWITDFATYLNGQLSESTINGLFCFLKQFPFYHLP